MKRKRIMFTDKFKLQLLQETDGKKVRKKQVRERRRKRITVFKMYTRTN